MPGKFASGWLAWLAAGAATVWAQQPSPTVIRTETKLVLVDVVVTGKKGVYVGDLEQKDFKVWEDNKEQQIKSFSFGADPNNPSGSRRYIVLFFDNSTMTMQDQMQARKSAQQFIESTAGPDHLIAIVNFTGSLQIAQNFTPDLDRLKQVVQGIRASSLAPGPEVASTGGPPRLGTGIGAGSFGARTMLLALRGMAQSLSDIPGRKTLILFTGGFPLTTEVRSETSAAISACNRANVSVYPIDTRTSTPGSITGADQDSMPGIPRRGRAALDPPSGFPGMMAPRSGIALAAWPVARIASLLLAAPEWDQQGGRGGGGGSNGGTPGGGSTGGSTGGGSTGGGGSRIGGGGAGGGGSAGTPGGNPGSRTNPNPGSNNPFNNNNGYNNNPFDRNNPLNNSNRTNLPTFPPSATDNQQVMYMLAEATGGFVTNNASDVTGALKKIGEEQNQYYVLGYTPPESAEGTCHVLKVKVDKGGTSVRARNGYCNVRSRDQLAGTPIVKTLESRVAGTAAGTIAASMRVPFFYTGVNTARVAVAVEIPAANVKFEKVKGKMHGEVNVLGIAYRGDGSVAARFSDTLKADLAGKDEVQAYKAKTMHYENQVDVGTGSYTLKVVFDPGDGSFGKLESPLVINAYDAKTFAMSDVAFSTTYSKVTDADSRLEALLLDGRSPLVAGSYQFTPSGLARFKADDKVTMYFEVYDPELAAEKQAKIVAQVRVLDPKTSAITRDSGSIALDNFVKTGSPVVATGLRVPTEQLPRGTYRLEVKTIDSAGNFAVRTADFEII